ncbi:hypothetical protein Tco_0109533 [Tanacetum coccineum]
MPPINRASTSNNPDPMIRPAIVEANYEVLESLLRERKRQRRNEDLRTELEYFSEEYDEEREMELRLTEGIRVERNDKGGRSLGQRIEDNGSQGMNLPPLLANHLGRSENGQPLQSSLTSMHGGRHPSTNIGGNLPPNGEACGKPMSHPSEAQGGSSSFRGPPTYYSYGGYALQAPTKGASPYLMGLYTPRAPSGLFADYTGCVTLFVRWIEDYPLPDGLKMPSHVGPYDVKRDPDNFLHLFECEIRMKK